MATLESTSRFFVNSLVTLTGAQTYSQKHMLADTLARLTPLPSSEKIVDKARTIYENSGVDTRHLELSIEELDRKRLEMGWHPIAKQSILSLGHRALEKTFAETTFRPSDCDGFVMVASCYDGLPGPSRWLAHQFGFPANVKTYDLGALACAGANHGLELATMLLETGKCKRIMLVCADVLGTHIQIRRYKTLPSTMDVVARALPSDGAAAMILSREAGPNDVLSFSSCDLQLRAWNDSITYTIASTSDDGEPYGSLSKELRTRLVDETYALLTPDTLEDNFILHPGAQPLMKAWLTEPPHPHLRDAAQVTADVLREHGNLGSVTVLHVLREALRRGLSVTRGAGRLRFVSFGPTVFTSVLRLDDVALR